MSKFKDFFTTSKKSADKQETAQPATESKSRSRLHLGKRKNNETLESAGFKDGPISAAMETLKSEPKLKITHDGKTYYLGLLVDANDEKIGGINKKTSHNNQAIGDFVEQIHQTYIDCYVAKALRDQDQFILLPTKKTIDALDQFSLFKQDGLLYKVVLFTTDSEHDNRPTLEIYSNTVNYRQVKQLLDSSDPDANNFAEDIGLFDDDLKDKDEKATGQAAQADRPQVVTNNETKPVTDDEVEADETEADDGGGYITPDNQDVEVADPKQVAPEARAEVTDESDEEEDTLFGPSATDEPDDETVADDDDTEPTVDDDDENDFGDDDTADDDNDDNDFAVDDENEKPETESLSETVAEADDDASEEAVSDKDTFSAITRKFFDKSLDLEATTKPLDEILNKNNHLQLFDTNRGKGEFNEQLNQIAAENNHKLQVLHENHISKARKDFFNLINNGIEEILSKYDLNDGETDVGKRKAAIEAVYAQFLESDQFQNEVDSQVKKLKDRYNDNLKAEVNNATVRAEQDYNSRFHGQLLDKIDAVPGSVKTDKLQDKKRQLKSLEEERYNLAHQELERMYSEALLMVMKSYSKDLKLERKEEMEGAKRLKNYSLHHHQEAVEQATAAQSLLEHNSDVADLTGKYETQIKSLIAKYDAKVAKLNAKLAAASSKYHDDTDKLIADLNHKHEIELANKEKELKTKIKDAKDEAERANKLRQSYADQSERYKAEKDNAQDDSDRLRRKLSDVTETTERDVAKRYEDKYTGQIDALKERNDALKDQLADAKKPHSSFGAIAVAAIVGALLGGGGFYAVNRMSQPVPAHEETSNKNVSYQAPAKSDKEREQALVDKAVAQIRKEDKARLVKEKRKLRDKLTNDSNNQQNNGQVTNTADTSNSNS